MPGGSSNYTVRTFTHKIESRRPRCSFTALLNKAFGQKGGNPVETILAELQQRRQNWRTPRYALASSAKRASANPASSTPCLAGSRPVGATTIAHNPEGEKYQHDGVTFVDLPGTGVPERPFKSYVDDLKLLGAGPLRRLRAGQLAPAARERGDAVRRAAQKGRQAGLRGAQPFRFGRAGREREATARRKIEETFRKHLDDPRLRVYMVSSPNPRQYDLPALLHDLVTSLPDHKRRASSRGGACLHPRTG